eukprot:Skav236445  [mRNA]  locus=scaffold2857:243088:244701:+ [translate_table: standard]
MTWHAIGGAPLLAAIEAGAFLGCGAAPDCSSFSRAVAPPVRDALHPLGKGGLTKNMAEKVAKGNRHAAFMLRVVLLCQSLSIPYWLENPDGSFLWLLPDWRAAGVGAIEASYRFDQCRYQTVWRKRTRIATSTSLAGRRCLCTGGHVHQVLRGRNSTRGENWTRTAQVYPRALCRDIGQALAAAANLPALHRLDVAGCSRTGSLRIGEAQNPGPQRARTAGPRDPRVLDDIRLVEPATAARQDRMLAELQAWLLARLSPTACEQLFLCPALAVDVLKTYAMHLFTSGRQLYELRYTLIAVQHRYPHLRAALGGAWALVSKWELHQPLVHRRPLPELLFKAMFVLAHLRGWRRWAATLLLGFEGIARIGEVLAAKRGDLLLPSDLLETDRGVAFLCIRQPKTRYRGRGRVQHLKVKNALAVPYLEHTFAKLHPCLSLFPGSAYAFRKKWDTLLNLLDIPRSLRPTPASIRGGGAILAYRRGEPVADILWRMRLASQPTLASYLQELAADSLVAHLAPSVKHRLCQVASLFPFNLQSPG